MKPQDVHNLLAARKGATFVSMTATRPVRLSKAKREELGITGELTRTTYFTAILNRGLEKVKERYGIEDAEYGFPTWGTETSPGTATHVLKNGDEKHYIQVIMPEFKWTTFAVDGIVVSWQESKKLMSVLNIQDKPVKCLRFGIESGDVIKACKKTITVG